MDPLFVANPAPAQISEALKMWPELVGKRIRPLLVTAFGDIFVEAQEGEVWCADPLELTCEEVATSVGDLERLFADSEWARERLLVEVALLAKEHGIERPPDQVFAVAPHPCFTGTIHFDQLKPIDLVVWHSIASQSRTPIKRG